MAFVPTLLPDAAGAQERGGWFGTRPGPQRDARPVENGDREAAVLYAEARADLEASRYAMAQRTLELLIRRYPQSALVEVASRDLQRLGASLEAARSTEPSRGQPAARPSASMELPAATPESRQPEYRPAALPLAPGPGTGPTQRDPIGAGPASGPRTVLPLGSAVRLANEDFRQQAGDRVFFAEGSADLGQRARLALEAQADWLLRHPDVRVVIEGHADDHGSKEVNRQLAEQRAAVVHLRLTDLGVPAERLEKRSFGRNEPLADCAEPACKTQNRRAVTVIVHVPAKLGFGGPAARSLGNAANVVGQPSRAP